MAAAASTKSTFNDAANRMWNIAAIGKTGEGKSATLNSLLHYVDTKAAKFLESDGPVSVTASLDHKVIELDGRSVRIVDTVGLFDTERTKPISNKELAELYDIADLDDAHQEVLSELSRLVMLCTGGEKASTGIHAFLFVIRGGGRFTYESKTTLEVIVRYFGAVMLDFVIFVVTGKDAAKDSSLNEMRDAIKTYLNDKHKVPIHDDRFVYFDNKNRPPEQVKQLVDAIENNVYLRQGGKPYTNVVFERAQADLQELNERRRAKAQSELDKVIKAKVDEVECQWSDQFDVIKQELKEKEEQLKTIKFQSAEDRQMHENNIEELRRHMDKKLMEKDREIAAAVKSATEQAAKEYKETTRLLQERHAQMQTELETYRRRYDNMTTQHQQSMDAMQQNMQQLRVENQDMRQCRQEERATLQRQMDEQRRKHQRDVEEIAKSMSSKYELKVDECNRKLREYEAERQRERDSAQRERESARESSSSPQAVFVVMPSPFGFYNRFGPRSPF